MVVYNLRGSCVVYWTNCTQHLNDVGWSTSLIWHVPSAVATDCKFALGGAVRIGIISHPFDSDVPLPIRRNGLSRHTIAATAASGHTTAAEQRDGRAGSSAHPQEPTSRISIAGQGRASQQKRSSRVRDGVSRIRG